MLSQIDVEAHGLSFTRDFTYQSRMNVYGMGQNVELNGVARIDSAGPRLILKDFRLGFQMAGLAVNQLRKDLPLMEVIKIETVSQGEAVLEGVDVVLGPGGIKEMNSLNGNLMDAQVKFEPFQYSIDNIDLSVRLGATDFNIEQLFLLLASGKIVAKARVENYFEDNKTDFNVSVEDVRVEELLKRQYMPLKVEGRLSGALEGKAEGKDVNGLRKSAVVGATVELKNGMIRDVNVLRIILSKIPFLPDLAEEIETRIPSSYQAQFKENHTLLNKVALNVRFEDEKIWIDMLEVDSDVFLLKANGSMNLDQNLYLDADVYISKDFSIQLSGSYEEFTALLDDQGRIHIPFQPYEGQLMEFRPLPDITSIGRSALKNKGKQEIKKAILKVLDIEENEEIIQEKGQASEEPPENQPSQERLLIEGVFDAIFK